MADFIEQDLSGSTFRRVLLTDALIQDVDLSRTRVRAAYLDGVRMTGVEVPDLEIYGELGRVVVNGVDVVPLVEAELDRRTPERVLMRPTDVAGFRKAFDVLDRLWAGTLERARELPAEALHEHVDGEWSFVETLRHLGFAHACWVGGVVLADPSPWHPLDLPWDEAPAVDGVPWDRDVRPSLDEVLALRADRRATVASVLDGLDDAGLGRPVTSGRRSSRTRRDSPWPSASGSCSTRSGSTGRTPSATCRSCRRGADARPVPIGACPPAPRAARWWCLPRAPRRA